MNTCTLLLLMCSLVLFESCAQSAKRPERFVGGPCEDCELMLEGMPESLSWKTAIADANEPGEPMILSGVIFQQDGKTPASNVILYVYHTDARGKYSPATAQQNARRHGHLRGWMKTDENGRYEFKTIRPGSYPNSNNPQHIHPIIKEANVSLYWIDEYLFEDDPLLSAKERERQQKRGGSGVIQLTKNSEGVWIGKRDIILGLNVPGYQ
jgi:protocatechuate 3,4-dioxygenase, beta subunit